MPFLARKLRFEHCEKHCSYLGFVYSRRIFILDIFLHPSLYPSLPPPPPHSSLSSLYPIFCLPSLPISPLPFPHFSLYPFPFLDVTSDIPDAIYVGITMTAPLFLATPHINNDKTLDDVLPEHVQKMTPLKIG